MASSMMFLQVGFVVMTLMGYLMEPSQAYKYYVGGKDGWSLKPSKAFNHWASLNRFQVHDSLIFEYKDGSDSVLQVDQEDYITCNKKNPIQTLENKGDYSSFDLDHSGFFFFISGQADNCKKGQRIIILVMAPRNYTRISPTHAPSPFQQVSAPSPSVVQGISPVSSQAPSPFQGISPVSSQAPSPFQGISPVSSQAPSPFQGIISPVSSQAPSPFQGISHAPSPIRQITHGLPPAHSPVQIISPVSSPAPSRSHRVPHVPPTHHHTHSPAPSPSHRAPHLPPAHHHTQSPAPSPMHVASHIKPPAPSPLQKITPISSPSPSPTPVTPSVSGPSQAVSPGPSDHAPSPNDGKSAAATMSFGGDLLMAVLLFWIVFN
ncbi:uncharacterized protein LOC141711564 [Apium graveolens]|uniref:uncharacterized protein LOC141711564 n=1 Tax=Apium graveolens TaxID=4045 RepID=UPI003D7B8E29